MKTGYFHQNYVHRPDGTRIFFELQGEGGHGVVLLDGLGCDGFAWKYLLPRLKEEHRVLRWHYRGHGFSGVPKDTTRLGISYTCEDLGEVIAASGIEKPILLGHSMGVQVALEYHRANPGKVGGLILLCGSYGRPLDTFHDSDLLKTAFPYFKWVVERFPNQARRLNALAMSTDLPMAFAFATEVNRKLIKRADLAPYFEHLSRMDPVVFVRTLLSLSDHSALDHLPAVDVPTLVIGGTKDTFTPGWLSQKMAAAIPGATLAMVEDGTHTTSLESPDIVWSQVRAFLERASVCAT